MQQLISHIYPGEFIPDERNGEESTNGIDHTFKNNISNCMINVYEDESHLKMDVFLPGLNKQDINLEVKNNCIHIFVNHFEILTNNTKFIVHEFENSRLRRKIKLPHQSDLAFITASFEDGLLKIHVPKCKIPSYGKPHQIAIY